MTVAVAEDTRVIVERLVKADPTLQAQTIADNLGISRQRVAKILADLGYRREWRKAKD